MQNPQKIVTYQNISYQTRIELIRLYFQEHISATEAGKILGLKSSTAKLIIRRYKKSGTVFKKKRQCKKTQITQKKPIFTKNKQKSQTQIQMQPLVSSQETTPLLFNWDQNIICNLNPNIFYYMIPPSQLYFF